MTDLLNKVLAAHGGLERWKSFEKASTTIVSGGELWAIKAIKADAIPRRVTAAIHREWVTIAPYGNPDWRMTFVPERVVIETTDNKIITERDHPRAAFAGHALNTPWDPLHRSYFNGYAMWTYLNTPFLIALPGVEIEEIAPWQEGEEAWHVLRATLPAAIESHCPVQEFYFGPDSLLRRHDYQVDISGSFPTAQYVYDIRGRLRSLPRSDEWRHRRAISAVQEGIALPGGTPCGQGRAGLWSATSAPGRP